MFTAMLRLPDDSVVCLAYKDFADFADQLEKIPKLLRYEKELYNSLVYHGVERVIKRGKIIFETTRINPDDLES